MWAQLDQSLALSPTRKLSDGSASTVSAETVRQLRSAASQWYTWILLLEHPGSLLHSSKDKQLTVQQCRPTDSHAATLFHKGFSTRLGIDVRPSVALLRRHVVWLDNHLSERFLAATSDAARRELCRAGLANMVLYLGWLRSNECFSTLWSDYSVTSPRNSASLDLPPGTGCMQIRLLAETKSERSKAADVVIAYTTLSGLCVGTWWNRLLHSCHFSSDMAKNYAGKVFIHENGTAWTSRFYRQTFLYPALEHLRAMGDPYLQAYDDVPGNTIPDRFWSLHCYRRAGDTEVQRHHRPPRRSATKPEMYEHARWRRKRSGEDLHVQYRDWSIRDRLNITLKCA